MPAIVAAMNGDEIRRLREARGMTQPELAQAIGVNTKTISNWERAATVAKNKEGRLRQFFGLDDVGDDPIAAASDVQLLTELLRRAAVRDRRAL